MTSETGQQPENGHDAWVRRQVQQTLDKKARGEMTYHTLDDVADELGFNAR
ncbi:hypothetical protein [uncultured Tateyamaria sp.]|uniref:hypothetical protein n=1 Tax=uncultured Tateyamaria sp. TaxID=455651 RepID=UPI00262D33B6|nr:hypothetical protein [uncultured Tateyamaria sp.]